MSEEKLSKPSYLEGNQKGDAKAVTQKTAVAAENEREVKPVVQGKVAVKKKPAAKRLRESLGLEETRTVGDYLVWDVLIPAAKEMVADLVKKGIDVFLYGGAAPSKPSRRTGNSRVSYDGYYNSRAGRDYRPEKRVHAGNRYAMDFREFVFDDRRDADMVLSEMCEIIDTYGFVKVSDFYSLVGETERTFTDHGYGWDALGSASVERVRDGWILDLPRPIPLN